MASLMRRNYSKFNELLYWVLHEIMDKGHKVIVVSEKKASRKVYMFEVDYGKDKQGIERDTETENVTTE